MSPPPVLVETNASRRPSGEKRGRDSVAGCETSNRATPPVIGTVQISPPDTKAISVRSGDMPGSATDATGVGCWAASVTAMVVATHAAPTDPSGRCQRGINDSRFAYGLWRAFDAEGAANHTAARNGDALADPRPAQRSDSPSEAPVPHDLPEAS